jgi:hypothetical protein
MDSERTPGGSFSTAVSSNGGLHVLLMGRPSFLPVSSLADGVLDGTRTGSKGVAARVLGV